MEDETIFIDTNVLVYASDEASPFFSAAKRKLEYFLSNGYECIVSPQIVREYLVVLTRGLDFGDEARSAASNNIAEFLKVFFYPCRGKPSGGRFVAGDCGDLFCFGEKYS